MSDLERIDGLFVGQLTPEELRIFNHAIWDGLARPVYQGVAGFLGLARVQLIKKDGTTLPR